MNTHDFNDGNRVYGNATVYGNARVYGGSEAYENAIEHDNTPSIELIRVLNIKTEDKFDTVMINGVEYIQAHSG